MSTKQIVFIHGGEVFSKREECLEFLSSYEFSKRDLSSEGWKYSLAQVFKDAEVLLPQMPNKFDARYEEWEVWFNKMIPFIGQDVILIGHSLGGSFLSKFLSENDFPVRIASLHLVAPPFDDESIYPLLGFKQTESTKALSKIDTIHLYFSSDDPVVPFSEMEKYKTLLPHANSHSFSDRRHFNQLEFPELIEEVRKDL